MKIAQLVEGKEPQKIPASKPRNFVAKNATSGGAGAHKDKKKAQKQGDVKHKKSAMDLAEGEIERQHGDLKPWAYWNSPERVAQKLYQIYQGEPIDKSAIVKLWKEDGPDRMTKFMMKPDVSAILSNYEAMSAQGSLLEYGDTKKGQTMLTKVQKRAVDRVTSKRADTDPKYAKKNSDTANRAWDRMDDKDLEEGFDPEYDDEAGMADNNLETLERAVQGIDDIIDAGDNLPEWCQEKIAVAKSMLVAVWDYMKSEEVSEATRNPDLMSPSDYDRYQQNQMDYQKRDFKRREMEHELADEEEYYQQQLAKQRAQEQGPWYIRIDGRVLKTGGQPKVFDHKKGANAYALAILKNKPQLQGKIMLTKSAQDTSVSEGQRDDPELKQTMRDAQRHYPGTSGTGAFNKFVQRSLKHSKEDDAKLKKQVGALTKKVNNIKGK